MPTIEELNCNRPSITKNKEWLISKLIEQTSITEIEMDYAVLRDKTIPHASFFIKSENANISEQNKEPEGSLAEKKLKQLKDKIKSQSKYPVHEYLEPKDIGDILLNELMEMIKKEFPDDGDDLKNSIISRHEASLTRHAFDLIDVPNTKDHMTWWQKKGYLLLLFTGLSGSGTSNSIALSTIYTRETFGNRILYYDFECADSEVDLFDDFLRFLKLNENQIDDSQLSILFIDNASILDMEQTEKMLQWLKSKSANLHVAFAASYSLFADTMLIQHCDTITQNGLTHEMKYSLINNFVSRYGKKLTPNQQNKIVSAVFSRDPTILTILLETLINFGSMERLDERINQLVEGAKYSIFACLIREIERFLREKNLTLTFSKALIGVAMHGDEGITEQDILDALNIPMGEWAVVKPLVYQFCHGNTQHLRFIRNIWRQDVKNHYSTSWISHLGCKMIEYWITQSHRIKESANAISVIYLYIWHLPFDKEEEIIVKQSVLSVMLSPDTVFFVRNAYLSVLWSFIWCKELSFSHREYSTIGRDYYDLSVKEKENYYHKLINIAESLGMNKDVAWCYRQISHLQTNETQAQIEEAHALLAEGRVKEAIKNVTGFMSRITGTNNEKLNKRLIRYEAFLSMLSLESMYEELMHIIDLMMDDEMNKIELFQKFYVQLCYNFSFIGVDFLDAAIEFVNDIIDKKILEFISISNPIYYYFYMAKVFINLKTSQFEKMINNAFYAMKTAYYAFGSSSYQYGRAHILYNYGYKKKEGKIKDGLSPYTNSYHLPVYKKKLLFKTLADEEVCNAIELENNIFDTLIKELDVHCVYPPSKD